MGYQKLGQVFVFRFFYFLFPSYCFICSAHREKNGDSIVTQKLGNIGIQMKNQQRLSINNFSLGVAGYREYRNRVKIREISEPAPERPEPAQVPAILIFLLIRQKKKRLN